MGAVEEDTDKGVEDVSSVSLVKALGDCASFTWLYDFGDYWAHKVKLERIADLGVQLDSALCITGANACHPPGDIGGAPGYEDFLQAIRDPQHPEHEVMREHCAGAFDPTRFDPMQTQEILKNIRV